jgi:hypothetical protein
MARTITRSKRRLFLVLAAAGALALVVVGAAYALTANSFKYSSVKTGYVTVSHMDFAPDSGSSTTHFNSWSGGLTDSGGNCLNAGTNLPQGSKVKSITFFYKSGAGSEFFGRFVRMNLGTGAGVDIAPAVNPANDLGTASSVASSVAAVNQPVTRAFSYGVGACPGSDGTFLGARIKYTFTNAGS